MDSQWTEEEYVEHLQVERRLFEWTLVRYGNYTLADAQQEAEAFYYYEPPTDKYRGLVFHEEAWHWAMLKIHGDNYWITHPIA